MRRDGICTSLWQEKMPDYETATQFIPARDYDVAIVGGGITGLTTALLLQKAGRDCILLEAKNLGYGTTGGTTAHINTYFESPYYEVRQHFDQEKAELLSRSAREAISIIKENIWNYRVDCDFKELPSYILAEDEQQEKELAKVIHSLEEVGQTASYVNEIPIDRPFTRAAMISQQAQFHPIRYIYGLAKAFEELGGVIVQNCRVFDAREDRVIEIETERGQVRARGLVYATHTPPGVNVLHFRVSPYRSYAMALKLKNNDYPDALVYDLEDPYHYYRTQTVNGQAYAIVGGEDHKTGQDNELEAFRKLEAHCRKYFDVEQVAYRWSSQFYDPADSLPYIGRMPQHRHNVYVATGFGGNGMTYGTISAMVIRDLIVQGRSEYEDLYDPNRVKPMAGLTTFVKENVNSAKEFISGWIGMDKLKELSELAHGEARVVSYEHKPLAIYKDEKGNLHAVSPVCPHMKCTVDWNNAEKSWDCPCHGSRFGCDGELLTGPAKKDLTPVQLQQPAAEVRNP